MEAVSQCVVLKIIIFASYILQPFVWLHFKGIKWFIHLLITDINHPTSTHYQATMKLNIRITRWTNHPATLTDYPVFPKVSHHFIILIFTSTYTTKYLGTSNHGSLIITAIVTLVCVIYRYSLKVAWIIKRFFSFFILSTNLYTSIITEPITTVLCIRIFYIFKIIHSPNM